MTEDDPIVQYNIVNPNIEMSVVKLAVQIGHVQTLFLKEYGDYLFQINSFMKWMNDGYYRKIVLKCSPKEWEKLKEDKSLEKVLVWDNGLTEFNGKKTDTVIGLMPILKSECPKLIKRLQLFK